MILQTSTTELKTVLKTNNNKTATIAHRNELPTTKTIQGLVKLYQPNKPKILLINSIGAPTNKINKMIAKFLNYNFKTEYNVENNLQLKRILD